jgi:hypothetical protein
MIAKALRTLYLKEDTSLSPNKVNTFGTYPEPKVFTPTT